MRPAAKPRSGKKKLAFVVSTIAAMSSLVVAGIAAASNLGASAAMPDCTPTAGGGNLCVLNPATANALVVAGSSSLTVARDLVVDSSSATAASASDSSTVVAAAIGGPGGFGVSNGGSFSPAPVKSSAQADPFAGSTVVHGACTGGNSLNVLSGSQPAAAGTYASLGAGGSGTLTLSPGIYTITGTFVNTGGGTINGNGVTLYFCPGASFSLSGSSSTTLSSPTGSSGFVIFYDPTSTGSFTTDAVKTNLVGAIYAKSASLQLHNLNVQGDVVADTVNVHSQGNVSITAGESPPPPTTTTTPTTSTPSTPSSPTGSSTPPAATVPAIVPAISTPTSSSATTHPAPKAPKVLAAHKVLHHKAVKKVVHHKAVKHVKHVTKKAKAARPVVKAAHFTG